jgi:hypothetical protein
MYEEIEFLTLEIASDEHFAISIITTKGIYKLFFEDDLQLTTAYIKLSNLYGTETPYNCYIENQTFQKN